MSSSDSKNYWKHFYNQRKEHNKNCSDFCDFVLNFFSDKNISNVLDCGCGNGRDSYTLSKFFTVHAVDNCGFLPKNEDNVSFTKDDFVLMDKTNYDLIYSRFTFHSINDEQHNIFLDSIPENTFLAIEARSKKSEKDDVYHGKTHYRNYIDLHYLKSLLDSKNFKILFLKEDIDMAKYKNENPICIRVICQKNGKV